MVKLIQKIVFFVVLVSFANVAFANWPIFSNDIIYGDSYITLDNSLQNTYQYDGYNYHIDNQEILQYINQYMHNSEFNIQLIPTSEKISENKTSYNVYINNKQESEITISRTKNK